MKLYIFFLTFLFSLTSFAKTKVEAVFVKGFVYKIDKNKKKFQLKKGHFLTKDDWVRTPKNTFAILKINGHSVHRIEQDTLVKINKLPEFDSGTKEIKSGAKLYLLMGTVLSEMEKSFDTDSLIIKSKSTTMGVRGTRFLVSKEKDKDLLLSVNHGQVEIENKTSGSVDFVTEGESLVVENDKTFTARQKYDFQKNIDWDVKNQKPKRQFKKVFENFRKEFKEKRKVWKADKKRVQSLRKKWNTRKEKLKQRIKNAKNSNFNSEKRREKIEKIRNDIKTKRREHKRKIQRNIKPPPKKLHNATGN
jgi:hypothetical protein